MYMYVCTCTYIHVCMYECMYEIEVYTSVKGCACYHNNIAMSSQAFQIAELVYADISKLGCKCHCVDEAHDNTIGNSALSTPHMYSTNTVITTLVSSLRYFSINPSPSVCVS